MARVSSRNLWTQHIRSGSAPASAKPRAVVKALPSVGRAFTGVLLGIDPSLRGTGLAVIEVPQPATARLLHAETIRLRSSVPVHEALGHIAAKVVSVLKDFEAVRVALEQPIYVQNYQTALALGSTRGAIVAAATLAGMPVYEYAPLRIKQAITGHGRATKQQVAALVKALLKHEAELTADESDAAAVGLCHALTWRG